MGLDGSGKTTLIKRFKHIPENSFEFYTTTPYINLEKVTLPFSNMPCIVYDLSGQVLLCHHHVKYRGATERAGVSSTRMLMGYFSWSTHLTDNGWVSSRRLFWRWRNIHCWGTEIYPLWSLRTSKICSIESRRMISGRLFKSTCLRVSARCSSMSRIRLESLAKGSVNALVFLKGLIEISLVSIIRNSNYI